MEDYDQFALLYDLVYQEVTLDLPFYQEIARQAGPSANILELACGSGRITIPMLKAGFKVTGLDFSPEMLDLARRKAEQLPNARWVTGDMRDLAATFGEEKFDLIYLGFNTFPELANKDDQLACLRSATGQLAPGGRFLLALTNITGEAGYPKKGFLSGFGPVTNPVDGSEVTLVLIITDHEDQRFRNLKHEFYEKMPDGESYLTEVGLHQTIHTRDGLVSLLEEAGFVIEQEYGDYDFSPYHEHSRIISFLAHPNHQ